MIEPYEVYKLYLAIKLHFTTKSYDVVKYKGKVRVKPETFKKRKDMVSIKKLARDYKREEIIDFLVANFVSGERWGGLFDIQASKRYEDWKAKKNQREYLFQRDVSKILLEMEKQKVGAFFEKNGIILSGNQYICDDKCWKMVNLSNKFNKIDQSDNTFYHFITENNLINLIDNYNNELTITDFLIHHDEKFCEEIDNNFNEYL